MPRTMLSLVLVRRRGARRALMTFSPSRPLCFFVGLVSFVFAAAAAAAAVSAAAAAAAAATVTQYMATIKLREHAWRRCTSRHRINPRSTYGDQGEFELRESQTRDVRK